ncbi:MAG: Lin0512 family protein [Tissierellales bacterium]
MAIKRYILEFGMGVDFHGQDVNRAAEKAVLDAISRSCLCGLQEILDIKDFNEKVVVNVTLSVSKPEEIDEERIKRCLPIGRKNVTAVKGGLKVPGLYIPEFGDKDNSIEAALACVEVEII